MHRRLLGGGGGGKQVVVTLLQQRKQYSNIYIYYFQVNNSQVRFSSFAWIIFYSRLYCNIKIMIAFKLIVSKISFL